MLQILKLKRTMLKTMIFKQQFYCHLSIWLKNVLFYFLSNICDLSIIDIMVIGFNH